MNDKDTQDIIKVAEAKSDGKFKSFLKYVFVKNAALKIIALIMGFLTWMVISIF